MKPHTIAYYFKEASTGLRRNGWMMFASVGITLVMFIILGFFLAITANLDYIARDVEGKLEITAYLDDGAAAESISVLQTQINAIPSVKGSVFVSNAEALTRLSERLGNRSDLLAGYESDNPLRNAFEITTTEVEQVSVVAAALEKLNGIAEVKYGREEVEKLLSITTAIRYGMAVLMLALGIATLFVMMNTIRLTVFARRQEIQIMKYVGATDWFIRWPFILEGMIMGVFGALLAGGFVFLIYHYFVGYVMASIPFLPVLPVYPFIRGLLFTLTAGGALIGIMGSALSLGRYLKV